MIFFVLSGYLIGYTTTTNNRGPKQYAVARLSRLYSIFLPAVLLTILCEILISYIDKPAAGGHGMLQSIVRYVATLSYQNEILNFSAAPRMNLPLWSLSYEFWYYLLFGLFFFAAKKYRWIILIAGFLIPGIKIIALLPVWLFGFFAFYYGDYHQKIPKNGAFFLRFFF